MSGPYGIAVKMTDSAGGPHLAGGQDWFIVEGQPVVVFGDPVTPHPPHLLPVPAMTQGSSSWMSIDSIPVIRKEHKASCDHESTGRSWFQIPD